MNRRLVAALAAVAVLSLAGCGSSTPTTVGSPKPAATTSVAATVPAPDASALATQLKTHVPSVTKVATITENNDQNNLIGRPNGYVSAAVLYDSGTNCDVSGLGVDCGATIEVWPTEQAATTRAAYIQGILSGGGMGSEWDFVKGGALLRVTGTLKPSAAGLYGANFGGRQINQSVPSSPSSSH